MTRFQRSAELSIKALAAEATKAAIADADLATDAVQAVFFANAMAGLVTGQEMIRGQAALRETGLLGLPIFNVENACASGSTATHLANLAVASGWVDVALAVGVERMSHLDPTVTARALGAGIDVERASEFNALIYGDSGLAATDSNSPFMDLYASLTRAYMQRSGATVLDFAEVAAKNRRNASDNPCARFRDAITVSEVLESRSISPPLTLLMCSPIADGAAAIVFAASRDRAPSARRVFVRASTVRSGGDGGRDAVALAAKDSYEQAALGAADLDVIELHDAAAPAELMLYEELGLCGPDDGPDFLRSGKSARGGSQPVNPSGGLLSRGHPVGATGCAQLVELTLQLRGCAAGRQVAGARAGLAQNGGGFLSEGAATSTVTILGT
jgi:acetyl-CoA acetyltransferase